MEERDPPAPVPRRAPPTMPSRRSVGLSVADIDLGHVLSVLEPIWTTIPETAGRIRARIEAVLAWATVRGYRTATNPAVVARQSRQGSYRRCRPWRRSSITRPCPSSRSATSQPSCGTREGIAARALEWTILTAARTGETIGATWDEIDFGAKLWTIPAARMKAEQKPARTTG